MNFSASVRVIRPLNIRSGGPFTSQPIVRREEIGALLQVVEILPGEPIKGESNWYREEGTGHFFWASPTTPVSYQRQELPASPPPKILMEGQLTAHFTLDELLFSQTATRHQIDNTPNAEEKENLRRLAEMLEIARALLGGVPMRISSGYRSPDLNQAIGGAKNSAHMKGLAADFSAPGFGTVLETARRLAAADLDFDQLINEHGRWVHLGLAGSGVTPRKQVLSYYGGAYLPGLRAPG